MESLVFESRDLGRTEEFLSRAYSKMQIGGSPADVRMRVARSAAASISLDRIDVGFDMSYDVDPLGKICLCEIHSGRFADHATNGWVEDFGPGDLFWLAPPDRPYAGRIMRASYGITLFDQALLTRVAGVGRRDNTQVRLLSHRPRSRAAAQHLSRTIAYVGDVLPNSDVRASPLVLASISHLLASSVIAAFPNTSDPEPQQGGADNRDGRPVTVRRALAFMESNLDQAISIADIAAAAGVTVRALQIAFRRHLGTTPLGQLRKLRLDEVRAELLAADPAVHTVAGVAARWGFHHPGRMTAAYRALYGELPSTTLSR